MQASSFMQFFTIAAIHFLAVASPGPDFAIVVRQSVLSGKRTAIMTSLGIAAGILVHVAYCLAGLGILISRSVLLFNAVKLLGAAYLMYIGWKAMRAKPSATLAETDERVATSDAQAFRQGFLTNVLNPKATLFFLSVFSVVIAPGTPTIVLVMYASWMVFATAAWFTLVSLFFSRKRIRAAFLRIGHWFERIMGVLLVGLGIKLSMATTK